MWNVVVLLIGFHAIINFFDLITLYLNLEILIKISFTIKKRLLIWLECKTLFIVFLNQLHMSTKTSFDKNAFITAKTITKE